MDITAGMKFHQLSSIFNQLKVGESWWELALEFERWARYVQFQEASHWWFSEFYFLVRILKNNKLEVVKASWLKSKKKLKIL